jgi:hypothetical protein
MDTVYVSIDGATFKTLIRGDSAELTGICRGQEVTVRILLSDIGFPAMLHDIQEAARETIDRDIQGDLDVP